jgi:hypothetical protein
MNKLVAGQLAKTALAASGFAFAAAASFKHNRRQERSQVTADFLKGG